MKPTSPTPFAPYLLTGCLLLSLHGCDKQDKTPPAAEAEPVVIPEADRLQPKPPLPSSTSDVATSTDTAVKTQNMTPPTPTEPEAMPASPKKPTVKIPKISSINLPGSKLSLRFLATGESFYTEIVLENGILSYTYFEDTAGRCAQWVKSSPCWRQSDLKTISMALPNEDLDNLRAVVQDSGILALKRDTFGDAKAGQRHYDQRLEVSIDGKTKKLVYQHFPGASKKPEAFAQLETALLAYASDLPH